MGSAAHSAALRNRLAKDTGKPRVARKTKGSKKTRATKTAKAASKPAGPRGPSLDERIVAFLGTKPMEWFTPAQVAEGLKESSSSNLSLAFARLVRYGRIAKQDDGRFAAVRK
jgi:hypothetical protein